jgi:hypothetical protein
MKNCQSIINLTADEKISFFCMDTSGNRSKYTYMLKHYPSILSEITKYSLEYGLSDLPFKEQCYLFANNIKYIPISEDGKYLKYRNFSKGYTKYSTVSFVEKNILDELNEIFANNNQIGGKISQKLLSNSYIQHKILLENITSFADLLFPKLRHRIWLYQNRIDKIPNCPICGNFVKFRETHSEFASTCGNKKCYIGTSSMEVKWLDSLNIPKEYRNYWLFHNGKSYIVDGINLDDKIIYEFYGDYWHGNPKYYKPDGINQFNKKTFGELYKKTLQREKELEELGYTLITKWEDK